ncbi:CAZyme family GH35 [Penicillium roqueforti]|nr:CAZyme family GH35 [Penicillium roqueforti]
MLFKTSPLITLLSAVASLVLASIKSHTPPQKKGATRSSGVGPTFYNNTRRAAHDLSWRISPLRLPVPGLWLDVSKNKEESWTRYHRRDMELRWGFDVASQAGLYLIARPGPYINAETTAGGIPGWVLREKGVIPSDDPEYLNATANYISILGRIIDRGQITNGGPVIMVQPENKYSTWLGVTDFPTEMNRNYMVYVEEQLLDEGLTVPSIVNDNNCANFTVLPNYKFPYDWQVTHRRQSPTTPFRLLSSKEGLMKDGEGWSKTCAAGW